MEYVLGIDGGGTKTHLVAMDKAMKILYEGYGGSSNLTSLTSGEVDRNLSELLGAFFANRNFSPRDCACLCLGTAGAGRETARLELKTMLNRWANQVLVTDDAQSALAGATETGSGILLIAGTGSICYARNQRGESHRTGGWGHIAGDEGSGYDMACQILRAVVRAADGRGSETQLTDLVMDFWSLTGIDQLIDALYRSGKGKSEIAALAILCDKAYDKQDKTAFQIMDKCAAGLAEMVIAAADVFGEEKCIPCICSGSLLEKSRYFQSHLRRHLELKKPEVQLAPKLHDAAWGCARLAWNYAEYTE